MLKYYFKAIAEIAKLFFGLFTRGLLIYIPLMAYVYWKNVDLTLGLHLSIIMIALSITTMGALIWGMISLRAMSIKNKEDSAKIGNIPMIGRKHIEAKRQDPAKRRNPGIPLIFQDRNAIDTKGSLRGVFSMDAKGKERQLRASIPSQRESCFRFTTGSPTFKLASSRIFFRMGEKAYHQSVSMLLTKDLLRTTDIYIKKLKDAGIETVEDFISHYPRTYENKGGVVEYFSFVDISQKNSVKCEIETILSERTRNGKNLIKAIIKDKGGFLSEAVWFNQRYLLNQFRSGDMVLLFGMPKYAYGKLSFSSPEIEHLSSGVKAIKPIYPESNKIPSEWFEKKMELLKGFFHECRNVLPDEIIRKKGFHSKAENLAKIHFPADEKGFEEARKELAYEELYRMQYEGLKRKKETEDSSRGMSPVIPLNAELIKDIISHIPYPLTNAQKIVTFQILKDMERHHAGKRLLQGDVGTGKTIVALITAIHAIMEGSVQVAFMVPTEILARQHFENIQELLFVYGIRSDLLVGSLTPKQKDEAKARLKNGETRLIVGTHALIQEDVVFRELGFVIIDEQHRFGVEQRKALEGYCSSARIGGGIVPHNLNMTATPIPRTLALTIYGDQDISTISEYPSGRKPIHTKVIKDEERSRMYAFIEEELRAGRQAYWISPLVAESETLDIANATQMKENLEYIFPNFGIGLLHGKMKPKEKDQVMAGFMSGDVAILSSTSVVEVGVNNTNATIICIEAAERFGLSQLHQFRGRVGRGSHQSYCYLFTTKEYKDQRLRAMEKTNNGFELSEIDLELRGPGEVYGVRQSGLPDFKIASLQDFELISEIREDLEELFGFKKES